MFSPPKTTRTHRGESSKYTTWSLGARTSKLNVLSPRSPNGPVPIVSVILRILPVELVRRYPLARLHLPMFILHTALSRSRVEKSYPRCWYCGGQLPRGAAQ